jgi:hypothetical protein
VVESATTLEDRLDIIVQHSLQIENIIKTLQQDLPTLFEQDISYDVYSQDIYFRDPVNRFQGKLNYRIIFWTLRFHAKLFFSQIAFDLHEVAQSADDTILAKWTVRGFLRVPWNPRLFFNGDSTYKLNSDNLIYEHVDTWDRTPGEILKQAFTGTLRASK